MSDEYILNDISMGAIVNVRRPILSLAYCFEIFSTTEILTSDDAWYCSSCKSFQRASKTLHIYHAPPILIIHLKRFLQVNRVHREKMKDLVDFPLLGLDLTEVIPKHALSGERPSPVYDLFGISVHGGTRVEEREENARDAVREDIKAEEFEAWRSGIVDEAVSHTGSHIPLIILTSLSLLPSLPIESFRWPLRRSLYLLLPASRQ
jgi:hypothetical protein